MNASIGNPILSYLRIRGRMTRSVSISRDIGDPLALDGYILTQRVQETAAQVGSALRQRDTQRAWRIVGPYGSGKSALGLLLCHMVQGPRASPAAFELINKFAKSLSKDWRPGLGWLPVVVSGSRRTVYACVVEGLVAALNRISDAPKRTSIHAMLVLAAEKGPTSASITTLVDAFAAFAQSRGSKGLFIIFDELGKCLEHASLNPASGDLFALQELVERTYGNEPLPIAMVSLVHQHFEEYARDLSKSVSDEWGKVSSRFQEIAFDEPFEQYLALIAGTLGLDKRLIKDAALGEAAELRVKRFRNAQENSRTKSLDRLDTYSTQLYPLHPTCAIALPAVFKRFAQSERSLFAFLTEEAPASLRDYCAVRTPAASTWYDIANLFDYLSQGVLRFRTAELQRKWEYAAHLSSSGGLTTEEARILKVIALVECCGPLPSLSTTPAVLEACLDLAPGSIIDGEAAQRLIRERVLILRRDTGEMALALDEAVRLDALEREALESLAKSERQTYGLSKVMGRPAIAHRHYHETGTLRTFEMRYGLITPDELILAPASNEHDGSMAVLFASPDCTEASALQKIDATVGNESNTMVRVFRLDVIHAKQLGDLSLWTRVRELALLRNADNWTLRHIDRKLEESAAIVRRDIFMAVTSAATLASGQWLFQNKLVPESQNLNVAQIASWLADRLYTSAPKVINEMINRNKLSSQIALARQRLVEAMIQSPEVEFLGIEGFPPERAIYVATLQATGIHRPRAGHDGNPFGYSAEEADPQRIGPLWNEISRVLAQGETVSIDQLLTQLTLPPFGIRLGISTVMLASYMLANRQALILFERGTLVVEPTAEHFARLFRSPQHFAIRGLRGHVEQETYLRRLTVGVRLFAMEAEGSHAIALTRVLARWTVRLSDYSKCTSTLSKPAKALRAAVLKATDPVDLLCVALPKAVDGSTSEADIAGTIERISAAIDEISVADRVLRDQVTERLGAAFGLRGSLAGIRAALSEECKAPTHNAVDYQLKSFVTRCVDPALTDDKWLESIAGLVTHRSLDNWTDETVELFSLEIKRFAAQLRRWIDLMLERGQRVNGAENLVRVAVTDGEGHEFREVFHRDILTPEARRRSIDALVTATGVSEIDLGPVLAALYLQYADAIPDKNKEETGNG